MPSFINKINPCSTAVIVVDLLKLFSASSSPLYMPESLALASKTDQFLLTCRSKGCTVIFANTVYRKDHRDMSDNMHAVLAQYGDTLLDEGSFYTENIAACTPKDGDLVVKKQFYSAFYGTNLSVLLDACHIKTIAIAGLRTDTGVHATARDCFYQDFETVILRDLTALSLWPDCGYGNVSKETAQKAVLNNLFGTNADVMTSEQFIEKIVYKKG